jgi:hypothetical protein
VVEVVGMMLMILSVADQQLVLVVAHGVGEVLQFQVLLDNQEQTPYMAQLIMDLLVVHLFQLHQHILLAAVVVQEERVEVLQIHPRQEMVEQEDNIHNLLVL